MSSVRERGRWMPAMWRWMLAAVIGLASAGASAVSATDAGVSIENEGSFLDSGPESAFLTRTTFYAGTALFTEAGAGFGVRPVMHAVVTADVGRWGQAVASLSDTITFTSPQRQLITVHSNIGGTWSGHGGGGTHPVSRVEVGTSLGAASFNAYTYPAGSPNVHGVFSYLVDPEGPDWTPTTLQSGSYLQQLDWSVYTNTAYRFSFHVLAVAGDGAHAEIHDPLWFDVPDGVTISAASGASYLPAVPEPGSWAMLLAGLATLAAGGRRARAGGSRRR